MRLAVITHGVSALIVGQALASPALTTSATTMRASPNARASIVQAIPANAEIDLNHCSRSWCYASWRDRFGYISARAVAAGPDGEPGDYPVEPPPFAAAPDDPPHFAWGPGSYWGPGFGWGYYAYRWHY